MVVWGGCHGEYGQRSAHPDELQQLEENDDGLPPSSRGVDDALAEMTAGEQLMLLRGDIDEVADGVGVDGWHWVYVGEVAARAAGGELLLVHLGVHCGRQLL